MLEQFIVDLSKGSVPRFAEECAGCGETSTLRLALPVSRAPDRVIELSTCATCHASHAVRRGCWLRSLLLAFALLAAFCIVGALFEEFEEGMQRTDPSAQHGAGEPETTTRLGLIWYALSLGFGALFVIGSWLVRDREPTLSVTCLGAVDRYAFLDEQAGRRFAKLNE